MDFLFIGIGLILGGTIVFLYLRIATSGSKAQMDERIRNLDRDNQELKTELSKKEIAVVDIKTDLAAKERDIDHLNEKLNLQKEEVLNIQKQFKAEFENLANKIFEDKSQKFVKLNQEKLDTLLNPLKEKIIAQVLPALLDENRPHHKLRRKLHGENPDHIERHIRSSYFLGGGQCGKSHQGGCD